MKSSIAAFSYSIIVVTLTIFFLHCDLSVEDDPPDDFQGRFEFSVTGEFSDNFSGNAIYGMFTHPESGEEGLILYFVSQVPVVQLTGKVGDIETNFEYEIIAFEDGFDFTTDLQENEFFGAFLNNDRMEYADQFNSQTGDVFFQGFEDEVLRGMVSFIATGYREDAPEDTVELFISGDFEAIDGDIEFSSP